MMKLRLLHISDLNSYFEALAKIATAIVKIRDNNTVVLDSGDNADFMRLETEGTSGRISSAILNKIGFHARVFGNNESFAGKINRKIIAESSNFPIVTCNIYDFDGTSLEYLEDSVIIDVSGLKVLIIGVTAPSDVWYELFELLVIDPQAEITGVLSTYEKDEYDVVVLLSHLGLEKDKKIASKNPNIDIIIGGHSHISLKEPIVENQTIICQAGKYGKYLGELILEYDNESRSNRDFKGRLIPSENFPPLPAICELIHNYSKKANETLSRQLYQLDTPT
ncbi:MAG: bifunctional metallophosphatase/5'-nucleotidase [Candidatus Heimdallarchaeota archaeon]